ncbi:NB-ARC domain-containing protein [Streptomyces sp. NBC_01304]|uniref:NB-ARC domain-containing protein n=1 Tax=Streptomyces sp. NBC_01304 TaxID=2903818 RepID=UPI002E1380C3|nr:NB-ARC domain-containing protein [Streptomyces sp. NBC_01304]
MGRSPGPLKQRLSQANVTLFLAGCLLVLVGLLGGGISLAGTSIEGPLNGWQQIVVGAFGALVLPASLFVGVPVPEPAPGAGRFLGARPAAPRRFVERPDEFNRLVAALRPDLDQPVALVGMAGAGKTVLAGRASHDEKLRARFPDGVRWIPVAHRPDIPVLMAGLARRLGVESPEFTTVQEGQEALAELLTGQRVLIVLDDVWDRAVVDAFHGLGDRCGLLFTSRDAGLARDLDAVIVDIAELSLEQSLELLARWADTPVGRLPLLADDLCAEVGNLALGISMVGAMARSSGRRWEDLLELLRTADLEAIRHDFGADYPHPTLIAAIRLSLDALPNQENRDRYAELAVFSGRGPFPRTAVEALWQTSSHQVGDLLGLFEDRSLLTSEDGETFTLHDLQYDVVTGGQTADAAAVAHSRLVEGYRTRCPSGWTSGPNDGYFLENLALHLAEARSYGELRDLLVDLDWMRTKMERVGVVDLLVDYGHHPDSVTIPVHSALQLSASILGADPGQLRAQLVSRLLADPAPDVENLVREWGSWDEEIWLRPLTPSTVSVGGPQRRILRDFGGIVEAVAFADDRRLVTGSRDGRIRVWEVDTGRLVRTITAHTKPILAAAVIPGGYAVAAASADGTISLCNLTSGRRIRTFTGHRGAVTSLGVSGDGTRLVSAGWDKTLRFWDVETGAMLATWDGRLDAITAVAVNTDGSVAVGALDNGHLMIWHTDTDREPETVVNPGGAIGAVAISEDGRSLVCGGADGTIRVWDVRTGELLQELHGHDAKLCSLTLAPFGILVSGGLDMTVRTWQIATGEALRTLRGHSGAVLSVAVSPDGRSIASGGDDDAALLWWLEGEDQPAPDGHSDVVHSIALSADGLRATSVGHDRTERTWSVRDGSLLNCTPVPSTHAGAHTWSADGALLASSPDSRTVYVVGAGAGSGSGSGSGGERTLHRLETPTGRIRTLAFSPDARFLAAGGDGLSVHVWDLESGEHRQSIDVSETVYALQWSGPERLLFGDGRQKLREWDVSGEVLVQALPGPEGTIYAIDLSDDGQIALAGGGDEAWLWNLDSGELLGVLRGHHDTVYAVSLSPDARWAVTASYDRTVRLWMVPELQEVARWTGDHPIQVCVTAYLTEPVILVGDESGAVYRLRPQGPDPRSC